MAQLLLHETSLAQWQSLVAEATQAAERNLNEELESYLVFALTRFTRNPRLINRTVALSFLRAMDACGRERRDQLRDVGDQCLLLSGLFPEQAARRLVRIGYFVNLGRSAYGELGMLLQSGYGQLYRHLSEGFLVLMDVLHAMRELGGEGARLEPALAMQIWEDTGSPSALRSLRRHADATPIRGFAGSRH